MENIKFEFTSFYILVCILLLMISYLTAILCFHLLYKEDKLFNIIKYTLKKLYKLDKDINIVKEICAFDLFICKTISYIPIINTIIILLIIMYDILFVFIKIIKSIKTPIITYIDDYKQMKNSIKKLNELKNRDITNG